MQRSLVPTASIGERSRGYGADRSAHPVAVVALLCTVFKERSTNADLDDLSRPLSHTAVIVRYQL
jgi:hypothetical protein